MPIAAPVLSPVEIEEEIVISRDLSGERSRAGAKERQTRRGQRMLAAQIGGEHVQQL
jgi:hypothetical protein